VQDITRRIQRRSGARVFSAGRPRAVIVVLAPHTPALIGVRLEGTRRLYHITADGAYRAAVRAAVEAEKRERAEQRKARAKERAR
jgi:hypothetical protein